MAAIPKPKTVKDPAYLAYVRTLPCVFDSLECRVLDTIGKGPSEASHLASRSRDDLVLPMCGGCHRTSRWSWHAGKKSMCRHFVTTEDELIQEAESLYAAFQESR